MRYSSHFDLTPSMADELQPAYDDCDRATTPAETEQPPRPFKAYLVVRGERVSSAKVSRVGCSGLFITTEYPLTEGERIQLEADRCVLDVEVAFSTPAGVGAEIRSKITRLRVH